MLNLGAVDAPTSLHVLILAYGTCLSATLALVYQTHCTCKYERVRMDSHSYLIMHLVADATIRLAHWC